MYDAAIVGAGAAGLAAAESLGARGAHVLLLEARDRIGGRILTLEDPRAGAPIELGAEFIHGTARVTFDLLESAGGTAIPSGGDDDENGDDEYSAASRLIESVDLHGRDESVDAFLQRSMRNGAKPEVAATARALVEGFDAADPSEASVIAIATEWRGGASLQNPQFRPSRGYAALMESLAAQLAPHRVEIALQTCVERIEWQAGRARITARRLGEPIEYEARKLILTLPIGVLQSNAVTFDPELPAPVREAIAGIAMGPVLKVALVFRERCWPEDGDFFFSPQTAFPTFWSTSPRPSTLIIGWAGGPKASAMSERGEDDVAAQSIADFATILGVPQRHVASRLEYARLHDWQRDPFARGAYSYLRAGALSAREALAQPVAGTLFFAGEATASHAEAGTVAGALLSGRHAAILAAT
jgi:monoamine oxidase